MKDVNKFSIVVTSIGLVLAAIAATADAGTFVSDPTTILPGPKTALRSLPEGADPANFIRAADYNALRDALTDVRSALMPVVTTSTTCPTCAAALRGWGCYVQGGTGAADTLSVCSRSSSASYAWHVVTWGP